MARTANTIPSLGKLTPTALDNMPVDTLATVANHLTTLASYATAKYDQRKLEAAGDPAASAKMVESLTHYRDLPKSWH